MREARRRGKQERQAREASKRAREREGRGQRVVQVHALLAGVVYRHQFRLSHQLTLECVRAVQFEGHALSDALHTRFVCATSTALVGVGMLMPEGVGKNRGSC
jgi:hypothetical protein